MSSLNRCFGAALMACGLVCSANSQAIAEEGALHAAHDALFASFLPVNQLQNDPGTTALLKAARDGMWKQIGNVPEVQQLLMPFRIWEGSEERAGWRRYCRTLQ